MKTFYIPAALIAASTAVTAQAPPSQDTIKVFTHKIGEAGVVMGGIASDNLHFVASEFSFEPDVVKGSPYSADAVTETTQTLADGNKISRRNTAQLYRDGEGRTRRDQTIEHIGPWSSKSGLKSIFINDPVAEAHYVLEPDSKTARKMSLKVPKGIFPKVLSSGAVAFPPTEAASTFEVRVDGPHPEGPVENIGIRRLGPPQIEANEKADFRNESLGTKVIEGVVAEGTRTTLTIPAGRIGNERPIEVITESWFSPELKTTVMTLRRDPRMGETTYKLTNLRRGEPGRHLFDIPPDYTLKESNTRKPLIEVLRSTERAPD